MVRVHLGPPNFRILYVFAQLRTKVRGNREKHTTYKNLTADASLYKIRQSDEDNTLVCRGALTKYCKGNDRSDNPNGGVAQLGEHLPCKQGVRSSILLISTTSEQSRLKNKSAGREFVKPPPCSSFSPKKPTAFPGDPKKNKGSSANRNRTYSLRLYLEN